MLTVVYDVELERVVSCSIPLPGFTSNISLLLFVSGYSTSGEATGNSLSTTYY